MDERAALDRIASGFCERAETSGDWDCSGAGRPPGEWCAVCVARDALGWSKGSAAVIPEQERQKAPRPPLAAVSELCRKNGWQNCHICEDAGCGDNRTPAVKALRDRVRELEARLGVAEASLEAGKGKEGAPAKWAYEQACAALWKGQDDAQAAAHVIVRLGVSHKDLDACGCEDCERVRQGMIRAGYLKPKPEPVPEPAPAAVGNETEARVRKGIARCRELLKRYEEIGPAGTVGRIFITGTIQEAEQALKDGDADALPGLLERLEEHE